jgi:hypothetical protein
VQQHKTDQNRCHCFEPLFHKLPPFFVE